MHIPSLTLTTLLSLAALSQSQSVTVPSYCTPGFTAGTDTVLYTLPYTYAQVISIIGSFKNLTWAGNPDNTVTLNGTDNTVGTARDYLNSGGRFIETITEYSKPATLGPYNEVHTTALFTLPSYNLSAYIPYDGTIVSSVCGGRASQFNLTTLFCGTNATLAGTIFHTLHLAGAVNVGKMLGGTNFTTCDALANASATTTAGGSPTVSPYHGAAVKGVDGGSWAAFGAVGAMGLAALF